MGAVGIEIERRFLVKDSSYKSSITNSIRIRQKYICMDKSGWVARLRITNYSTAELTIMRNLIAAGAGRFWEVDEFTTQGIDKLVIAEIELDALDEVFDFPSWLGEEITNKASYSNLSLARFYGGKT